MRQTRLLAILVLFVIRVMVSGLLKRQERAALTFPVGGSIGYLLAIAIPLEVPGRNIYLSHNFEANYGVPTNSSQYFLWYQLFKDTRFNVARAVEQHRRLRRQAGFSRTYFYDQLVERLELYGYNGTGCIERIVCETAKHPMGEHNGVFGDIMTILFSPSTSHDEGLPTAYYEAESSGAASSCTTQRDFCELNLLDLVSIVA